jgi:hypothetical protein
LGRENGHGPQQAQHEAIFARSQVKVLTQFIGLIQRRIAFFGEQQLDSTTDRDSGEPQ